MSKRHTTDTTDKHRLAITTASNLAERSLSSIRLTDLDETDVTPDQIESWKERDVYEWLETEGFEWNGRQWIRDDDEEPPRP